MHGRGGHFGHSIQGGFTYNLALIGPAVSEKKMLEHCERRRRKGTDGRWTMGILQARLRLRWANKPPSSLLSSIQRL